MTTIELLLLITNGAAAFGPASSGGPLQTSRRSAVQPRAASVSASFAGADPSWMKSRLKQALDAQNFAAAAEIKDELRRIEEGIPASNYESGYEPWQLPRPQRSVDEERRSRSPGLANNFYETPTADFKRPWGGGAPPGGEPNPYRDQPPGAGPGFDVGRISQQPPPGFGAASPEEPYRPGAAPAAPTSGLEERVTRLEQSQGRLEAALVEASAREDALAQRLTALEARAGAAGSVAEKPPAMAAPAPAAATGSSPAAPTPAPAPPPAPVPTAAPSVQVGDPQRPPPMMMSAGEIKEELTQRRISFGDCFDKDSLVDKLVKARAGLIRPSPPSAIQSAVQPAAAPPSQPPSPQPERQGFQFGAETRQSDNMDMDDVFKAAGWNGGGESDVHNVDSARSPGLKRNFGAMGTTDFRKPYTGGQPDRKGRYD